MDHDGVAPLAEVFDALCKSTAITLVGGRLQNACLNLREYPSLQPHIKPVVHDLYHKVRAAGIEYDAIASIPTGGDAWASAFWGVVAQYEGREVPRPTLREKWLGGLVVKKKWWREGRKVLLFDDTVYTGATAWDAARAVKASGSQVAGFVFPIELGDWAPDHLRSKGYPVFSTFNSTFVASMSAGTTSAS